jgi:putative redox protein
MGVKISGKFVAGLAMQMVHDPSGTVVTTDPPVDNGGQGVSFSPTDLVATALGSCMMSVMTIAAKKEGRSLDGMACTVEKHMSQDLPRRIIKLDVCLTLPATLTENERSRFIDIAWNCPVIHSLNQQIFIDKKVIFQ